jgi:hypothetical protein
MKWTGRLDKSRRPVYFYGYPVLGDSFDTEYLIPDTCYRVAVVVAVTVGLTQLGALPVTDR